MFTMGDDLFFIGRASCAKTVEDGRDEAFRRGVKELLNYAQAASTGGVTIDTQMTYEERDRDCPPGAMTVWRLLRVETEQIAKMPKGTPPGRAGDETAKPAPRRASMDLTPRIGMSREELLETFGRPRSMILRRGSKDIVWEYPRTGLTLVLDEYSFLKSWRLSSPQSRPQRGSVGSSKSAAAPPPEEPPLDLTDRLRRMEADAPPAPPRNMPPLKPRYRQLPPP